MAANFTQKIMATLRYALPENSNANVYMIANIIGAEAGIGTIGGSVRAEEANGSQPGQLEITFSDEPRYASRARKVFERVENCRAKLGLSLMQAHLTAGEDDKLID